MTTGYRRIVRALDDNVGVDPRRELRPAEKGDAASLAELHVACWQEAYSGLLPQDYLDGLTSESRLAMWRRLLNALEPGDVMVAAIDDELVGFVAVDRSGDADADATTGQVSSIYVRAKVWGSGTGRALMDLGVARLQDRGFSQATLWVLDTNARARRFYEVGGWHLDGTKTDEIGGAPVAEVRYRMVLS